MKFCFFNIFRETRTWLLVIQTIICLVWVTSRLCGQASDIKYITWPRHLSSHDLSRDVAWCLNGFKSIQLPKTQVHSNVARWVIACKRREIENTSWLNGFTQKIPSYGNYSIFASLSERKSVVSIMRDLSELNQVEGMYCFSHTSNIFVKISKKCDPLVLLPV